MLAVDGLVASLVWTIRLGSALLKGGYFLVHKVLKKIGQDSKSKGQTVEVSCGSSYYLMNV